MNSTPKTIRATLQLLIRNHGGFTWIELIVVMVIIGIISAVAVGSLMNSDTGLAAQAEVIKAHIRYAQLRSMNTESVWYIKFLSSDSYSLYRDGDAAAKLLPGGSSNLISLSSGMSIDYGSASIVSFDGWGRPCTDAAAQDGQASDRILTLADGSGSRTILITRNTGFIP